MTTGFKHISVLAFPRALGTSITLPLEMLNAADALRRIQSRNQERLNLKLVSCDGKPIKLTGGIQLIPDSTPENVEQPDLIIVPAMWGNPQPTLRSNMRLVHWLEQKHEQGAIICATGTGTCFLAEAGLLDYKPATTHWYYFDAFEHLYPKVQLQTKRFITNAGRIYCAGRINSITNLMIYFIEQFFSQEIARQVERHFAHEIKQSYESIFYSFDEQELHPDEQIIQAQQWILRHYAERFTLEEVARAFDMSPRNFNRRFRQATGITPLEYCQQVRIGSARELLKESNLSIAEISDKVGLSDPGYFSSLFKRQVSISPREYRRMVRAKLFHV